MSRVYNFSAGPAVLPEEVLKEAAEEMLDYKGTGMSVMEMSHRSKTYDAIIKEAEADLRDLMNIPDNYKVLFLQGGASQQFAMIPMNLMNGRRRLIRRHVFMVRRIKLLLRRIRLFLIYRTVPTFLSVKMRIMSISVRTIPFMGQSLRLCPIPRVRHWLQTCPVVFYPNLWM